MSRYLALHWDRHGLRLVEGQLRGQQLHLGPGLGIPVAFDPSQAEAAGINLKAQLQAGGIRPAPVVATVGRDSLLGRDVRHPEVPSNELAAVVQFQVFKELAVPADDFVLDFQPLSFPWPSGERRSLALLLPRQHVAALETLCRAAGLKLSAIVPHASGMLAQLQGLNLTGAMAYVRGDELIVARGGELLYSRHLESDEGLALQLRQALAAYRSAFPQHPLAGLLWAGNQIPVEIDEVADKLGITVQLFDPFHQVRSSQPLPPDFDFTPAIGALEGAVRWKHWPFNFAAPKRTEVKTNRSRLYVVAASAAAVFLFLMAGGWYWLESSDRATQIEELTKKVADLKAEITAYGNTEEKYAAIASWQQAEVVVLDELYDLAARFPDMAGVRITRATWVTLAPMASTTGTGRSGGSPRPTSPLPAKKSEQPVAQVILEATADSADLLPRLRQALETEKHWQIDQWERDPNNPRQVRGVLKVYPLQPREFQARLELGQHRTQPGEIRTDQRLRPTVRPRTPTPGGRP
jgi:hypothetical protein